MIQRSLILGVCLAAVTIPLTLMTPHPNGHGGVLAMADVRNAVEHVNTWHLKGWKSEGDKQIPWEVWGRRSPFFYHERIGEQETLDDGKQRTIVFPANALYGTRHTVVLKLPSRPSTQSSMGLSFALGLDRQQGDNKNKPWSQEGDTETFLREEMLLGADPAIQVNGLFTFKTGSSLPVRYERLMRKYHLTKNAEGVYDLTNLPDSAKEKEWTGAHLDAQYDQELDPAAFQISTPADARQIDAVSDAGAPSMPTQNVATQNGLTLHVTQAYTNTRGEVVCCLEGYVGSINLKDAPLPFSFEATVGSGVVQDRMGNYQDIGSPHSIVAHDERGRAYVAVPTQQFLYSAGERVWLAFAPLDPLPSGATHPRQLSFLMEMTLTTYQPVIELQSNVGVNLSRELLPLSVELPAAHAEMDLKALSKQNGHAESLEKRGFTTHFERDAAQARAEAWLNVASDLLSRSVTFKQATQQTPPVRSVDPVKRREAEKALQSAIHYVRIAVPQVSPDTAANIKAILAGLQERFRKP